jgi:hypothetical protein
MPSTPAERKIPRRTVLRLLAAAPAAAAIGSAALGAPVDEVLDFGKLDELAAKDKEGEDRNAREGASPEARFIADVEDDLTRAQRRRLLEKMPALEDALKTLRAYPVADAVEPAFVFSPMKSRGPR